MDRCPEGRVRVNCQKARPLNPLNSLNAEKAWCASTNVRADAERTARYRNQAAHYRQCAAQETVSLARDCLLDMARHLEQLANELEASNRRWAVDRFDRIAVH
jgi:hypothetical protein